MNKECQWVETIHFDHQKENKQVVKKIDEKCKQYKEELKEKELKEKQGKLPSYHTRLEVPFKMAKFTDNAQPKLDT